MHLRYDHKSGPSIFFFESASTNLERKILTWLKSWITGPKEVYNITLLPSTGQSGGLSCDGKESDQFLFPDGFF